MFGDMRPQEFLGRFTGREWAQQLSLPDDSRLWSEADTLLALNEYGHDVAGNIIIGERSYQRWLYHN